MAISIRPNEKIVMRTNFHWSTYVGPAFWMLLWVFPALGQILKPGHRTFGVLVLLFGAGPLIFRWLANQCKDYVLTTERLYLEDGILAKSKKDIPLNKINDIELTQGLIQRVVGSGNLLVLTGNDKPKRLKDIDSPDNFKNEVSRLLKSAHTGEKQAS